MPSLKARLAKAKSRLFGTAPKEIQVPFQLACDCGHRVTGIRRPSYQLAVCSACQSTVYVLPVNVYPANRRVRSDVIDGPVMTRVGTVLRDLVLGEPEPSKPSVDESKNVQGSKAETLNKTLNESNESQHKGKKSRASRAGGEAEESRGVAPSQPDPMAVAGLARAHRARTPLSVRIKRLLAPTRLLALAGVAILLSTGWWTLRQRQMDQARKVWRTEMDRAQQALKKRDIQVLGDALTAAVSAARTLHRSDAELRDAESLLYQTQAVQELGPLDIVGHLTESSGHGNESDGKKSAEAARAILGQVMLFQAEVRHSIDVAGLMRMDLPLIVDDLPVVIHCSSQLLKECSAKFPGQALLFTAQVRDCRPPSGTDQKWVVTLSSASVTLITTELHATELGLDVKIDLSVRDALKRQNEFLQTWTGPLRGADQADSDPGNGETKP